MSLRVDVLEGARIAFSSIRSNRLRTALTLLGIGMGVATLLAIVGIIQGLNASFAQQLSSLGSNTFYVSKFPWIIQGDWWEYRNRKDLTMAQLQQVRSQARFVTAASPQVTRTTDVAHLRRQLSGVRIQGISQEYLGISGYTLQRGRFLTEAEEGVLRRVVVLGADLSEGLFPGLDPLGASVRIDGRSFQVVGTLARKGKLLGESQDMVALIPFRTFVANFGKARGLTMVLGVERPEDLLAAEDHLVGTLRRLRGTPPDKADDFSINRPEQLAQTYEQLTGALYGVAVGVGLITLLVGGIGIMNIMLVSVRERTREIGIRRALGARKRTIVLQFLMEAAAVSAAGGAAGTAVGLGVAKLVSWITPLAAAVEPLTVVGGVGFAALVGLLFGIWPAARAAQLDPVEALRYE